MDRNNQLFKKAYNRPLYRLNRHFYPLLPSLLLSIYGASIHSTLQSAIGSSHRAMLETRNTHLTPLECLTSHGQKSLSGPALSQRVVCRLTPFLPKIKPLKNGIWVQTCAQFKLALSHHQRGAFQLAAQRTKNFLCSVTLDEQPALTFHQRLFKRFLLQASSSWDSQRQSFSMRWSIRGLKRGSALTQLTQPLTPHSKALTTQPSSECARSESDAETAAPLLTPEIEGIFENEATETKRSINASCFSFSCRNVFSVSTKDEFNLDLKENEGVHSSTLSQDAVEEAIVHPHWSETEAEIERRAKHTKILVNALLKKSRDEKLEIHNLEKLGSSFITIGRFCNEPIVLLGEELAASAVEFICDRGLTQAELQRIDSITEIIQQVVSGVLYLIPGYSLLAKVVLPVGAAFEKLGSTLEQLSGEVESFSDKVSAVKLAVKAIFGHGPILAHTPENEALFFERLAQHCRTFPIHFRGGFPTIALTHHGRTEHYRLYEEVQNQEEGMQSDFYVLTLKNKQPSRVWVYFDLLSQGWKKLDLENSGAKEELNVAKEYNVWHLSHPVAPSLDEAQRNAFMKKLFENPNPLPLKSLIERELKVIPLAGRLVPVKQTTQAYFVYSASNPGEPKREVRFEMQNWHLTDALPTVVLDPKSAAPFEARPCPTEPKNVSEIYLFPNQYGVYTPALANKHYLYLNQKPYEVDKFIAYQPADSKSEIGIVTFTQQPTHAYSLTKINGSNQVRLKRETDCKFLNLLWEAEAKEIVSVYNLTPFLQKSGLRKQERIILASFPSEEEAVHANKCRNFNSPTTRLKDHALSKAEMYGHQVAVRYQDEYNASIISAKGIGSLANNAKLEETEKLDIIKLDGKWQLNIVALEKKRPELIHRLKEYTLAAIGKTINEAFNSERSRFILQVDESFCTANSEALGKKLSFGTLVNPKLENETNTFVQGKIFPFYSMTPDVLLAALQGIDHQYESLGRLFGLKESLRRFIPRSRTAGRIESIATDSFIKFYSNAIELKKLDARAASHPIVMPTLSAGQQALEVSLESMTALQRPLTYFEAFQKLYGPESSDLLFAIKPDVSHPEKFQATLALRLDKLPGISLTQISTAPSATEKRALWISALRSMLDNLVPRLEKLNHQLFENRLLHKALNADYLLYDAQADLFNLAHFDIAILFPEEVNQKDPEIVQAFQQQEQALEQILEETLRKVESSLSDQEKATLSFKNYAALKKEAISKKSLNKV